MPSRATLLHLGALPALAALVAGCSSPDAGAGFRGILFSDERATGRTFHVQEATAASPAVSLDLPATAGNLQTAPSAGLIALTVGSAGTAPAELQLLRLGPGTVPSGRWTLAREWAWDFSLRPEGDAIAWVAGTPERRLFHAHAPDWQPRPLALPAGAVPSAPRWLDARRLAVVLRRPGGSELVSLEPDSGASTVLHRAAAGNAIEDLRPVPGTSELLCLEFHADGGPARVLSIPLGAGAPRELARGFFRPGSLSVSPDGRFRAIASAPDMTGVQRRTTRLEWLGAAWPGAPAGLAGVDAIAWSPDGQQVALARSEGTTRTLEVRDATGRVHRIGDFAPSPTSPHWWLPPRVP